MSILLPHSFNYQSFIIKIQVTIKYQICNSTNSRIQVSIFFSKNNATPHLLHKSSPLQILPKAYLHSNPYPNHHQNPLNLQSPSSPSKLLLTAQFPNPSFAPAPFAAIFQNNSHPALNPVSVFLHPNAEFQYFRILCVQP